MGKNCGKDKRKQNSASFAHRNANFREKHPTINTSIANSANSSNVQSHNAA